jgi:ubiquinone/menaquinone biosynthesis C-methylase UbiE
MDVVDPTNRDGHLLALLEDEAGVAYIRKLDEMLLKRFVQQEKGTTLQLGCPTHDLTDGLLKKIAGTAKLVVIDSRLPLLDSVRFHMGGRHPGKLFFKSDLEWERLPFDDEVFNTAISNLYWDEAPSREGFLADMHRVLLPGGSILLTVFLEDSFHEFYDLFGETITKFDLLHLSPALQQAQSCHPGEEKMLAMLESTGYSLCRATAVETPIRFSGSKEFASSPLVNALWLERWSQIAGEETDRVMWHLREAMDRYFSDRSFTLSTRIGVLSGIK